MRKIAEFCMLFLVFAVFAFSVSAQSATTVSIGDTSVMSNSSVTMPIVVNNVTNLSVGRINVVYNSSVVHVTNVASGTGNALPVQDWNADNTRGIVRILALNANAPHSGDVIFANVTYKAVGNEGSSSSLNIIVRELGDYYYTPIPHTITNGSFTITSTIDNTPPVITIRFPQNGSTLGILNNLVTGSITDESVLETAYLTLNDEFVTTLTKGHFNVKVNYTASATNKIEVFARDVAGNANFTQVLVNVLPNIVVVNKTTVPNQTIEITEAKNATNTVIELNATKEANVTVTLKANTNASALNAEPATSTSIYGFAQNQNLRSLEKYIDVNVTGIDRANLTFVSLKLYYTIADLDRNGDGDADDPGDLNEQTLKIYWFNPNPNEKLWMPLGPGTDADGKPDYTDWGGPKVIDDERNTNEKYLKVTLNHFSTFALVAEEKPAPVTPTPTPSNGRSSGGGDGYVPPATPTEKTPAAEKVEVAATTSPTLAPTITPSAAPTPTPTSTPAPVLRLPPLFLILIVTAAIVIAGVIIIVMRRK